MKIAGITDIGLSRRSNQDAFKVGRLGNDAAYTVVCDGMGGANGGQIASQTAVEVIERQITQGFRGDMSGRSVKNMLTSAIQAANASVYDRAKKDPSLEGMGTTAVVCLVLNGAAHIAHAGDSRAYLIAGGECTQLTRDHSMVQQLLECGEITQEQAKSHPRKHIITRAVGVNEILQVDYGETPVYSPGAVVSCSDGLSNYIEPQELLKIHGAPENDHDLDEYVSALVDLAKQRGGADNITAAVIEY